MIFSLDVLRARKGDCLLLHFGSKKEPSLIMIDGGPKSVYGPHLKPRLAQIRKARKLADNEPLPVDLLMVSHVDDDHIQGILDLTKELIEAQDALRPLPVQIMGLWHNSFDAIIRGKETTKLTASIHGQFGAAALNGELPDDATVDADDEELAEEAIVGSLKVLASIEQGFRLRSDATKLGIPSNPEFDGELILAEEGSEAVDIVPNVLSFTVAGPMRPEIEKLREKHEAWLIELKKKGRTPSEALAAYVDKSIPNLSSVVVLAQAGGKSLLLTGDARGDKILEGLETVNALEPRGKLHVDVLKVPHHGSARNLDDDFFDRIIAKHYVFSGNGEHGNPERESLEMLFKARGNDDYTIHLTYPIDEIDELRKEDWKKEQNKEKNKKKKDPAKKVRPNWSPAKHSLRTFFDKHAGLAKKVQIVDKTEPHLIDLLDPVTF